MGKLRAAARKTQSRLIRQGLVRKDSTQQAKIRKIFRILEAAMGPQHWWPAGSAFEVILGAYLTQNTAWTNVELAMGNLRQAGVLSVPGIRRTPVEELERLVRSAGYFRQKAARLKRFVEHLDSHHGGSLDAMFAGPLKALREELLGLNGIGPETADSILLYAASREVFVVDAYTRRIFERHGLAQTDTGYEAIRAAVESALVDLPTSMPQTQRRGVKAGLAGDPPSANEEAWESPVRYTIHAPSAASAMARSEFSRRYNEFHALLVQIGKHYCVKGVPRCETCPLRALLGQAHPR